MSFKQISIVAILVLLTACGNENVTQIEPKESVQTFENKGHQLVFDMVQTVGNYNMLAKKKDVIYEYTYTTPDGQSDVSTEKYVFKGELSYGAYSKHERTFSDLEGEFEQGSNGKEFWLKHEGKILTDTVRLKRVAFNRPTNFYWFTMFQKLLDPGLTYEHVGEKTIDDANYDIVKVSFQSQGDKPTDIYQLYVNKKTHLVDQFLFTVADFGKVEIPFLMKLEYEKIDGMLIPSKRRYKTSTWDADVSDEPWINVTWTQIKFNNGLKRSDFVK